MGISKSALGKDRDVFVDYELEEVMFRWDAQSGQVFRKFYGADDETLLTDHSNRLFNDVLRFGDEIDAATYALGRARR
ncbi:hypothetical protein [Massilia orientalis]|jgi:hypothetical protein|uniref:Uncharacterized protein n=1 Tax=Massilia orientalis TaxID=3050128 RepID=A0ACC7M4P2_9BURK|nr:hypothetical protein [Massilia sp. YIM B02787]